MLTFWKENLARSGADIFQLFGGWKIMIGILVFVLMFIWRCRKYPPQEAKKFLKTGLESAAFTAGLGILIFILYALFVAPGVIYNEQLSALHDQSKTIAQLNSDIQNQKNSRPTPIRTKYINLAEQLLAQVDEADKHKAEWTDTRYRSIFWGQTLNEFESRIDRSVTELADHGQRSVKFNELAMHLEINRLTQSVPPSALRDMANEMKRMAEHDDE